MSTTSIPASLSASVVASISVLRAAAGPAREHAQWLQSGHIMTLGVGELGPETAPVSVAALGDNPAAISEAILRALFGPGRAPASAGRRTVRRPGLEVRELRWDQVAHLFDGTVMQHTLDQSPEVVSNDLGTDGGAIEPTTATHPAQRQ